MPDHLPPPGTISAFFDGLSRLNPSVAITVVICACLAVLTWFLRKDISGWFAASTQAKQAELAAHQSTTSVNAALVDKLTAIPDVVRADGALTRASVAEVRDDVGALASALPRTCPVPRGERPDSCPVTPAPIQPPATPAKVVQ
jgi:hypothetical protein